MALRGSEHVVTSALTGIPSAAVTRSVAVTLGMPKALGMALVLLTALASSPALRAQAVYGRAFTVTAEPAKAGLGDSVTLHFRLTLDERDLLTDTVPAPVDELPPGVRLLSRGRLSRGVDRVFRGSAVLAFYRPGTRAIPAFGLPWVQIVTGQRGIVSTEPAKIEVASVLPGGNPSLRDIREPDVPGGSGALWALLGAAVAVAAAWLAARRWRERPVHAPEPLAAAPTPAPPSDPYSDALARLDAIEAEAWATRGEVASHYAAVADALRDYLEAAEALPARERTTTELLWSLPPRLSEGGLRRRLQDLLGEADMVKFAKVRPGSAEATRYTTRARDLLERWHRAAPAVEEMDAAR